MGIVDAVVRSSKAESRQTELYESSERKALEVVHSQIIWTQSRTCMVAQAEEKRGRKVLDRRNKVIDKKVHEACFFVVGSLTEY